MTERKYYIDVLKTIGLLFLILAHVDAPMILKEIRVFDVPLMIFVSGLLASNSFKRTGGGVQYFWKRIERLVIPTWIFLVFFYMCMFASHQLPDILTIIKSFCFQRDGGIAGYTWIILIYIWCALLTSWIQKFISNRYFWVVLITIAIINESLMLFPILVNNRYIYYTIFSAIPYGLFMSIGIKYNTLLRKEKIRIFIYSVVMFVGFASIHVFINGKFPLVSSYKYPAKLYYFSYALPVIIALTEILTYFEHNMPKFKIVEFISKHSLWIYLWHMLFMAIIRFVLVIENWIIAYIIVVFFSVFFTWIQNWIIEKIEKHKFLYIFKYFKC